MTREEEQAAVRRVLSGDANAFEALVKANERGVYNLALRMLGSEQDALDASQEAFFRAYRSLDAFRGDSKFSVWLYRITGNVCLDMLRRAGRRMESSLTVEEDGEELPVPDRRGDPQEALERKELRRAVREGLKTLEPAFRQALILRDLNGLTYDEIAQVTGLEPGTVKSRIFRARRKLAAYLRSGGNFSAAGPSKDQTEERGGEDRDRL